MPAHCSPVDFIPADLAAILEAWNIACPTRHVGALGKVVHELRRDHFTDRQILIHCVGRLLDALTNGNW